MKIMNYAAITEPSRVDKCLENDMLERDARYHWSLHNKKIPTEVSCSELTHGIFSDLILNFSYKGPTFFGLNS